MNIGDDRNGAERGAMGSAPGWHAFGPRRVLAECDAKLAIIEEAASWLCVETQSAFLAESILRALAAVYADRPGYRQEWALTS